MIFTVNEETIIVEHNKSKKINSFIDIIDDYIIETGNKVNSLMRKLSDEEAELYITEKTENKVYSVFRPINTKTIVKVL